MQEAISLWPLIGIAVIVVGFVLRFNPVLVVIISGIVTGVAAHMPIATILEKLGEGFLNTRNLPFILLLPLAVIGLLERHGLKERAQAWIAKIHSATAGTSADRLSVCARSHRRSGVDQPRRTSANGAPAAGADGGGGGGKALWPAAGQCTLPPARDVGGDR